MNQIIAIAIGGGLGAVMRHFSMMGAVRIMGDGFPYGTMFVNILGSFLIGLILEMSALKWNIPLDIRAFLVTGFLGGFTTFSAFSFDVYKLAGTGQVLQAVFYAAGSVALSVLALLGAVYLVRGTV